MQSLAWSGDWQRCYADTGPLSSHVLVHMPQQEAAVLRRHRAAFITCACAYAPTGSSEHMPALEPPTALPGRISQCAHAHACVPRSAVLVESATPTFQPVGILLFLGSSSTEAARVVGTEVLLGNNRSDPQKCVGSMNFTSFCLCHQHSRQPPCCMQASSLRCLQAALPYCMPAPLLHASQLFRCLQVALPHCMPQPGRCVLVPPAGSTLWRP